MSSVRKLAYAMSMSLVLVSHSVAEPPLSVTRLGSLTAGPLRGEDLRIAEIHAFDALGRRIYVVNPMAGRLDVVDARDPRALVAAPSVDLVAHVGLPSASSVPCCRVPSRTAWRSRDA